jgi:hypothetical protein
MAKRYPDWFAWFDDVCARALRTRVGKLMTAQGYTIAHTGGGCMCWEKSLEGGFYLWICDEGNGLGDKINETYLVGCYAPDGPDGWDNTPESLGFDNDTAPDLHAALAWCALRATDPARFIAEYNEAQKTEA